VVGRIDYLIYTVFSFPTGVVDSLISSYFLIWKTKTSSTGKTLNSSDHHLGTSPLLLRLSTTPAGISICIIIKESSGHPSFKRRGNV
jgi:hypothetical protein